MKPDLALIERWLAGRSLARGLALPVHCAGGLRVDVDHAAELRRHVFVDAGPALQACAAQVREPLVFLKAAVEPAAMRAALPDRWKIEARAYLMQGPSAMDGKAALPAGYRIDVEAEHGGQLVRIVHGSGATAASGRMAMHAGCAVFDQIVTEAEHRRRGLASVVMHTLDGLAARAGSTERLLVATEDGRALYERLGWQVLAPWATAVLPGAEP